MDKSREQLIRTVKAAGRDHNAANLVMLNVFAAKFGLSGSDIKTLDTLDQHGPLTAGAIAERTGLATPSVTALIDRLEKKEFVTRQRDAFDRRRVYVAINSRRYAEVKSVFGSFGEAIEETLTRFTDDDLSIVLDFLRRTTACMREQAEKFIAAADEEHGD